MKSIDENIYKTRGKVDYYGNAAGNLLKKKEYSNFLNIYLKLLYENLIKYQALTQVKIECESLYNVKEKNIKKDKETERE